MPGLLLFFVESSENSGTVQTGFWFEVVGHGMLVLVAVATAWAVRRAAVARLVRRVLRGGLDWLMVGIGRRATPR